MNKDKRGGIHPEKDIICCSISKLHNRSSAYLVSLAALYK